MMSTVSPAYGLRLVVFTLVQEDRFAYADRLIDTILPAHFS